MFDFLIESRLFVAYTELGLAKRDLWGLGAESWFVVASYAFAKMILQLVTYACM